mgnify:CR=1 FL=1|jgi:FKBP-type peptidyl-prolyl cis-trans isomerase FkpA
MRNAAWALLVATLLTGCSDSISPQIIESTQFADVLGIDLDKMTRTATGLYVEEVEEGQGDPAVVGDVVAVTYTGRLSNGDAFDAGQFTFTIGVVGPGGAIAGFDEGVRGMRVDGIRRIVVPPSLGYGDVANGPIPGGSILIFDLQLDSIN